MNRYNDNKIWAFAVIIVVSLLSIQFINNMSDKPTNNDGKIVDTAQIIDVSDSILSGNAAFSDTAVATLCINIPPIIDYDCNLTNYVFDKNNSYACTLNATDPNGDSVTFYSEWLTSPQMFNISSEGNINFTPQSSAMGRTNTVRIHTSDSSGCSNNDSYIDYDMTVTGDNRAPYLSKNMTNQELVKDKYFLFRINDFFTDPDGDTLSYFSIMQTGGTVKITINNNQVIIKGLSCGISTLYYVASDPLGLTAQSNSVSYDVKCADPDAATQSNTQQQTGGGGGGSGAEQNICTPNWKCSAWSACQMGNFTFRRCIDYNGCDITSYDHYMFENCTYSNSVRCTEDWECNEWSSCTNDIHTRLCLDLTACGTNKTKPVELEKCNLASCFNNIQDGNETGIDCGGECMVCKNVENPSRLSNISIVTIIAGSLITIIGGLTFIIFRKNIHEIIFGKKGRMQRAKRKIYITAKQKDKLLQIINIAQVRMDEHKGEYVIDELSLFIKEYFKQLLSMDTVDRKDLITKIVKLKDKDLEKMLIMFYAKIAGVVHLKNRGIELHETELQSIIDEISHNLYLIADFSSKDAEDSIKQRSIDNSKKKIVDTTTKASDTQIRDLASTEEQILKITDSIYNDLSNIYIALKFGELIAAKNMYKGVLVSYDKLPDNHKTIIYNDIIRAFHAITYLENEYKK